MLRPRRRNVHERDRRARERLSPSRSALRAGVAVLRRRFWLGAAPVALLLLTALVVPGSSAFKAAECGTGRFESLNPETAGCDAQKLAFTVTCVWIEVSTPSHNWSVRGYS